MAQILQNNGGAPGINPARIREKLVDMNVTDPDNPTDAMYQAAQDILTDEYLAMLFIRNSDQNCYGELVRDLEN